MVDDRNRADLAVVDFGHGAAGFDLGVVQRLFDAVDQAGGDATLIGDDLDPLVDGLLSESGLELGFEFLEVVDTVGVGVETVVVDKFRPVDGLTKVGSGFLVGDADVDVAISSVQDGQDASADVAISRQARLAAIQTARVGRYSQ